MLLTGTSRRLGIFFFYDDDGIVDDYIRILLSGLTPYFDDLTIVVNGKLNSVGRKIFASFTEKILVRPNEGFDVWAYKTALQSYGWDSLQSFDEVVLFNSTIMGPVYPFSEMFESMNKRDVDFWGITKFHKVPKDPFHYSPYGYLPEHIQSHFHAYRKSLFSSQDFQEYWDQMPEITSYYASVGIHESLFTKRFSDLGYKWDVYVNTDDFEGFTYSPITYAAKQLVEQKRCPIFKRRSFFHDYQDVMNQSVGNAALDLYDYLDKHTEYDVNLIWQNALRTMNIADIVKNLHLDYVLSQNAKTSVRSDLRIALLIHVYYPELLDKTMHYIASMPAGSDVIVTVSSESTRDAVAKACEHLPYDFEIKVIPNRGRDVSSLLVAGGENLFRYDYVCFAHDKKVRQISPESVGDGFAVKCFENILASQAYVTNVIDLFENNPRLGIAMPSGPNHADYFPGYSFGWGPNFDGTKKLLHDLGCEVPLDAAKEPVAPLGTMFWFRPKALHGLLDREWQYSDFPEEPNKIDGSFLHYVERAYGYVPQSNGYYPAYIFSDRFARIELTNLSYELREITRSVADPWLRPNLAETVSAVVRGKRFRFTVLRIVKNVLKRIPGFYRLVSWLRLRHNDRNKD